MSLTTRTGCCMQSFPTRSRMTVRPHSSRLWPLAATTGRATGLRGCCHLSSDVTSLRTLSRTMVTAEPASTNIRVGRSSTIPFTVTAESTADVRHGLKVTSRRADGLSCPANSSTRAVTVKVSEASAVPTSGQCLLSLFWLATGTPQVGQLLGQLPYL